MELVICIVLAALEQKDIIVDVYTILKSTLQIVNVIIHSIHFENNHYFNIYPA